MLFLLVGDNIESNEKYMMLALKEAMKADTNEEIPVGVIIVKENKVIAKAYNRKEMEQDPTRHAEIIAIQKASKKLNDWRLNDCLLFVTLEPCVMCMGAIIESRVSKVIYGATNKKYHSDVRSLATNNNVNIEGGILKKECEKIIRNFFEKKRKK